MTTLEFKKKLHDKLFSQLDEYIAMDLYETYCLLIDKIVEQANELEKS